MNFYEPENLRAQHKSNRQASEDTFVNKIMTWEDSYGVGHSGYPAESIRKHNQTTVSKSHMDETSLAGETKASGGDILCQISPGEGGKKGGGGPGSADADEGGGEAGGGGEGHSGGHRRAARGHRGR